MNISFDGIILRDYQLSDVEDEVRWTNSDTAWFYANTPWMTIEPVDPEELRADMIQIMAKHSEDAIRWRFEIEVAGQHIGMVSSYYLDKDFEPTPWNSIDQQKMPRRIALYAGLVLKFARWIFGAKGLEEKP